MKILINAIRLNSAGGLRVGQNLLKELDSLKRDNDEIIFLCSSKSYSDFDRKKVDKEFIHEIYLKTIHWPYAVFDQDYIWKKMSWIDYV